MEKKKQEEFVALVKANERIIYKVCSFYISPAVPLEDLYQEVETSIEETSEDRVALLYRIIATLNDIDKAVILLWLEEKSYAEIAEITGLSPSNVGVRLGRIKNKLKSNELWNSTR